MSENRSERNFKMKEKLLQTCAEVFCIDQEKLSIDTSQEDLEEWDSLAQVQLIAEIEEAFHCRIPFEKISRIKKISDFLDYIEA